MHRPSKICTRLEICRADAGKSWYLSLEELKHGSALKEYRNHGVAL